MDKPRRALILSADIGEGHNAAARALVEAAGRVWPDCEVRWLDALACAGPGFGPLARAFYVGQVRYTPGMYEFFFSSMWNHRRYLDSTRNGAGALFGRRMAPRIRAYRPDVIMSTYPLGSAGLSWLRRRGELPMPAGAWIPAFCPHPSWLYDNLDVTYVVHPAAAVAERAEPGARIAVGAFPVRAAFAPGKENRKARFVVVVCGGSLAFGRVGDTVTALLAADENIQVVAVCGRNARLRRRLTSRHEPPERLSVLGWTDDMPAIMAAADVVVTNGGGATALEAVSAGTPVVMWDVIAGHGKANAELMATAGLAESPADLTAAVRLLARDPGLHARAVQTTLAAAAGRRIEEDLAGLIASAPRLPWPRSCSRSRRPFLSASPRFSSSASPSGSPERRGPSPRLLIDLARRPMWLAALTVNVVGNALQVVALHLGALALVQPLLVCGLVFAVLISVAARHQRPDTIMLTGVICCAAGLACFLAVAPSTR